MIAAPACTNHVNKLDFTDLERDETNIIEGYINLLNCAKNTIKKALNGTGYEQYFIQYEQLIEQTQAIVRKRCAKFEDQDLSV